MTKSKRKRRVSLIALLRKGQSVPPPPLPLPSKPGQFSLPRQRQRQAPPLPSSTSPPQISPPPTHQSMPRPRREPSGRGRRTRSFSSFVNSPVRRLSQSHNAPQTTNGACAVARNCPTPPYPAPRDRHSRARAASRHLSQ